MNYPDNMNMSVLDDVTPEMQEAFDRVEAYENALIAIVKFVAEIADKLEAATPFTKDDAACLLDTINGIEAFDPSAYGNKDLDIYPGTPHKQLINRAFRK